MKKYFTCLLAVVVAISATSFTQKTSTKTEISAGGYRWFNFNGGLLEICDPSYYSPDSDNFPDCPPALGIIYCEIYAQPSAYDPEQPDLSTVIGSRMRSLL